MNDKNTNAWIINGLLAVILVLLAGFYIRTPGAKAYAAGGGWETDGMMALSTSNFNDHIVLIDTSKKNIMVYRVQNAGGFGLIGARSYKYDVLFDDTSKDKRVGARGLTYQDAYSLVEGAKKPK